MQSKSRYIVGIDLGTTHCAVSFTDLFRPDLAPAIFPIDQLVAPGEVARQELFPSSRYHPWPGEFAEADLQLPWASRKAEYGEPVSALVQGALARVMSGKSLGRSVASAKSWLSHGQVDREAAILPWAAPSDVEKVSPVTATAGYLHHLRQCWDWHHPDHPLAEQYVVLTVPASFDEDARQLTLKAAEMARLPVARLLEEPTAAFYAWYWNNRQHFAAKAGALTVLVCDVGGGTSDFTLLKITPRGQDHPVIERVGVGNHLLLGGDNMDLAIAWRAESSMGGKVSASSMQQLAEESRRAKEACLGENPPEAVSVTLLGSGSKLIGGSRTARLNGAELKDFLLESFFPPLQADAELGRTGSALVEAGLPYEKDPAITRHILRFLRHHRQQLAGNTASPAFPDAVLFNGGPFNSGVLRRHLMDIFGRWRGSPVEELTLPSPDTSVAMGAVVHGLALQGRFTQVTGGSARHYYLLTETAAGEPVGVCLLPKGAPEAAPQKLENRRFRLTTGETVAFRVATSTEDVQQAAGQLHEASPDWHLLPPLVVRLEDADQASSEVEVELTAELTEVGVLQLSCEDVANSSRRWRLDFQARKASAAREQAEQVLPHPNIDKARAVLATFFQARKQEGKAFKALRNELEQLLGERDRWSLSDNRVLADELLGDLDARKRSAVHERAWLHWTGFCLRPGTGHPLDPERQSCLARLYEPGVIHRDDQAVWAEWWNMWRRVAAGLSQETQVSLAEDVAYYLHPSNARSRKRQSELAKHAYDDMVRMMGALEDLPVERKVEAGSWLIGRLRKPGESPHTWWALGRIGSRLPFSNRLDQVIPPDVVKPWLEAVLEVNWRKQHVAALAATLMARKSGDRALDVDEDLRQKVLAGLRQARVPDRWPELVEKVVQLEQSDQGSLFGESLPVGLTLVERAGSA